MQPLMRTLMNALFPSGAAPDTDNLLLESGDALLLESGDLILLESA